MNKNHRCFFCACLYKGWEVGRKYLGKEDKQCERYANIRTFN